MDKEIAEKIYYAVLECGNANATKVQDRIALEQEINEMKTLGILYSVKATKSSMPDSGLLGLTTSSVVMDEIDRSKYNDQYGTDH